MDRRVALRCLLAMTAMTAMTAMPAAAHPGHEYHAKGSVTKVRGQIFEVDGTGGKVTFALVAGTEVFIGKVKGAHADIKVGVRVEVDGIENDRGMVEAKTIRVIA